MDVGSKERTLGAAVTILVIGCGGGAGSADADAVGFEWADR